MTAEFVELAGRGAIGLVITIDGVTIEGHGDGFALTERFFEKDRSIVVMVVVALAAVAAEFGEQGQ